MSDFEPTLSAEAVRFLRMTTGRFEVQLATGERDMGTGVVVKSAGRDMVITAAHMLDDLAPGSPVIFVPAYDRGDRPFGVWEAYAWYVPDEYLRNRASAFDVAVVLLKPQQGRHIQDVVGGQSITFDDSWPGWEFHMLGYTGYGDNRIYNGTVLYPPDPERVRIGADRAKIPSDIGAGNIQRRPLDRRSRSGDRPGPGLLGHLADQERSRRGCRRGG